MDIGIVFRPELPPEELPGVARDVEAAGLDQLWLWEDCFLHGGTATAAVALARTDALTVGVGLFPVPLRNPAVVAMETASLARLFPGRYLPVLGHGVLDWMGQVGNRVASPLTLLAEHTTAVRDLLAGREVTRSGRYVSLDRVRLDHPPTTVPPVLVGGRGPRTLRLAGDLADGVLLDSGLTPADVRSSLDACGPGGAADGFRRIGYVALPEHRAEVEAVVRSHAAAGPDTVVLVPPAGAPDPRPWLEAVAAARRTLTPER
ncbi:LLM class flavin-dependent oxidoreductase [Pseudonocardia alni]|jgi:alkanesulfonate monooxygenase SsuD/methylene tetrahydromethanopterin reductase-like flavin-dependent oxidoreductase (luciferase family)|uniref:LLM class flavin-dependent oxidoreductase n=1 Tax=Pseudonocardia alni TaxID=33907 RepID=UPI001AD63C9D|nr:LLM class flavin-dependent oxidoreductase [Pseudonocardia alni]MBO4239821.1 LLM class flavin-dependent oxidoreductase [Pseudonocardia alni]